MKDKKYDLIVFAATGVLGRQVAERLALMQKRQGFTWAIAGRSLKKLDALKRSLKPFLKSCVEVGLIRADGEDYASLCAMAAQGHYVVNALGQGATYKLSIVEAVVRACIDQRSHYVDASCDSELVDFLRRKYHRLAQDRQTQVINLGSVSNALADLMAGAAVAALGGKTEGAREAIKLELFRLNVKAVRGYQLMLPASDTLCSDYQQLLGVAAQGRVVRPLEVWFHWHKVQQAWASPLVLDARHPVLWSAVANAAYGARFEYAEYGMQPSLPALLASRFKNRLQRRFNIAVTAYPHRVNEMPEAPFQIQLIAAATQHQVEVTFSGALGLDVLLAEYSCALLAQGRTSRAGQRLGVAGGVLSPAMGINAAELLSRLVVFNGRWELSHV